MEEQAVHVLRLRLREQGPPTQISSKVLLGMSDYLKCESGSQDFLVLLRNCDKFCQETIQTNRIVEDKFLNRMWQLNFSRWILVPGLKTTKINVFLKILY